MDLRNKLSIWQQNVNKSPAGQHNLISSGKLTEDKIDIVALQEPAVNAFNQSIATRDWITIYPTTHGKDPSNTRSLLLLHTDLSMDTWNQMDLQSGDVTAVQITGPWGKLNIFNIYNEGKSNGTLRMLAKFHDENQVMLGSSDPATSHTIWLGDFNRHHPYWDDPNDTRIFTREALKAAEVLIEVIAEVGLEMALPSGTPTHYHNVMKQWTRLDQVFLSEHSDNVLITCDTLPAHRGIKTDHLPILMELNLSAAVTHDVPTPNFRNVDWDDFRKALSTNLTSHPSPPTLSNQRQIETACDNLTIAIQCTIREQVPVTNIMSKTKRWWTKELTQLRRVSDKLGRRSYNCKSLPKHSIHTEHKEVEKKYKKTMEYTKRQHWRDWLEKVDDPDIWAASKLISAPSSDGGKARIPILNVPTERGELAAKTNNKKSAALAKCFFPPKLSEAAEQMRLRYPKQCQGNVGITAKQISSQIGRLRPFKAPGPDGIPNVVLMKCADTLINRLCPIYTAIYESNLMYKPWKSFTTVVLRKPGKPQYDIPKAYRPIALLNTLWKVLVAVVATQLTHVAEKHNLLPSNHFGGRPGRTTMDTMHLLASTIKASWHAGKVTSVLFLDIEGAFPNAVPLRLVHNLHKRKVPGKIVKFISNMLKERVTTLKFDGYTSEPIKIDNGIGRETPSRWRSTNSTMRIYWTS